MNWQGAAGLGKATSSYPNPNPNMGETTRQRGRGPRGEDTTKDLRLRTFREHRNIVAAVQMENVPEQ